MPNRNVYTSLSLPDETRNCVNKVVDQVKRAYPTFKPQPKDGLHLTFVYLGDKLSFKQTQEVWAHFQGKHPPGEVQLSFKGYDLFPPDKQNLIVALFDAPVDLVRVRSKIVDLIGPQNLKDADPYEWVPHITLGKLVGKIQRVNFNDFPPLPDILTCTFHLSSPYPTIY